MNNSIKIKWHNWLAKKYQWHVCTGFLSFRSSYDMVYSCYSRFLLFSLSSTFSNVKILSFIGGPWFPKRQNCWLGFVIEHRVQIFPGNSGTGHFPHWPLSESCKGKHLDCLLLHWSFMHVQLLGKCITLQNYNQRMLYNRIFMNIHELQSHLKCEEFTAELSRNDLLQWMCFDYFTCLHSYAVSLTE